MNRNSAGRILQRDKDDLPVNLTLLDRVSDYMLILRAKASNGVLNRGP